MFSGDRSLHIVALGVAETAPRVHQTTEAQSETRQDKKTEVLNNSRTTQMTLEEIVKGFFCSILENRLIN